MGEIIKKLYSEQDFRDALAMPGVLTPHGGCWDAEGKLVHLFEDQVRAGAWYKSQVRYPGIAKFTSRTFQVPASAVASALRLGFEVTCADSIDTKEGSQGTAMRLKDGKVEVTLRPNRDEWILSYVNTTSKGCCTFHVTIPDVAANLRDLAKEIRPQTVATFVPCHIQMEYAFSSYPKTKPATFGQPFTLGAAGGTGLKYDGTKNPVGKLPWKALAAVARACEDDQSEELADSEDANRQLYNDAVAELADVKAENVDRLKGLIFATRAVLQMLTVPGQGYDLPGGALLQVLEVLKKGAAKYTWDSWQGVRPVDRYIDAAIRHLFAWSTGEELDPEFGTPHLAHAACCLLFSVHTVLENDHRDVGDPLHPDYTKPATPAPRMDGMFECIQVQYTDTPKAY